MSSQIKNNFGQGRDAGILSVFLPERGVLPKIFRHRTGSGQNTVARRDLPNIFLLT
jgi:hypothetical protein